MTYETRGRQYVAATAGNIGRTTFGVLGSPTLVVLGLGRPAQAGAGESPAGAELALPEIATGNAQNLSVRTGALGEVASQAAGAATRRRNTTPNAHLPRPHRPSIRWSTCCYP